ncbi:O-Antigen Polymerase family [Coleofasciculus chthonoplastes PCC 7420]|uniref:O-Antigen Polymerase family n=1 Tax=Coleofasciculus chthonoplastes PCC 7420 TaxID=118168 RepID=B4VZZ4_9CYAN|nr:O-antigen ligase family protein [Coleofasciculus chthonoplastes]EDX72521.1 O-Antigen Polymerase family [Coleofasciculus chthonoplastes PCC 7420]
MLQTFFFILLLMLLLITHIKKPYLGFIVLMFLQPWMLSRVHGHYLLSTASILIIGLVIPLRNLSICGSVGYFKLKQLPELLWVYLFCTYMFIQVIWICQYGLNLRIVKQAFFYLGVIFFVLFYPNKIAKRKITETFLRWTMIGGLFYFLVLLILSWLLPRFYLVTDSKGLQRLNGIGGTHPAYIGSIIPIIIAGITYYLLVNKNKKLLINTLMLGGMTIISIVTIQLGSRAVILSIVTFFVAFIVISDNNLPKKIFVLLIVAAILFIAAKYIGEELYIERLNSIRTGSIFIEIRWLSIRAGFDLLKENYVFGVGVGQFAEKGFATMLDIADSMNPGYAQKILTWRDSALASSGSIHLFFLIETGLIGFLLYGKLLFIATKKIWQARLRTKLMNMKREKLALDCILSSWFAFLLHLFTISGETHLLLWTFIAFAFALPGYPRKNV